MRIYGYFRSSAAYRVRIALALKGLSAALEPVHLLRAEQRAANFLALNPQGLVPVLVDDSHVISQSLAICEYLDEAYPDTSRLLCGDAAARARIRSLALLVACDIHPLNNLRVLQALQSRFQLNESDKQAWYQHWVCEGFNALEQRLAYESETGVFCHGDVPTLADVFLVPQVYNAQRAAVDMQAYPTINRVHAACMALPAFASAHPEVQADAM